MKVGFVILHYITSEDTMNCVTSIREKCMNCPIVIVDNSSPNDSYNHLSVKYMDDVLTDVIKLKKNEGFARGNNAGIAYMRKKYDPDFICVLNNDTLILSDHFDALIENEYEKSAFAVLGPQIITPDGTNFTSPVECVVDSVKKVNNLILKRRIKLFMNQIHLHFLLHNANEFSSKNEKYNHKKKYENVKLHGCCWIFSRRFFEKLDGLNPLTFLYFEEDILFNELRRNNLLTVYLPDIVIKHLEDSSTKSIVRNTREKNIFIYKNELKSLKILRDILNGGVKRGL